MNGKKNQYMNAVCVEEDEIDLIELLKVIKKRRKVIYITVVVITLLAIVYVYIKTPLYEVKSNLRIGFIGKDLIVEPTTLVKTLQSVYHVDDKIFKAEELKKSGSYVENIKQNGKKVKNFIEIVTMGLNNKKALNKNKDVVSYVQQEYKSKLDQYVLDIKSQIDKLEISKKNILNIDIPNLETKVKLIEKQNIPFIQKEIDFLKNFKLKKIEEQKTFLDKKLREYNQAIEKLYEQFNKADDTKIMIASIQMINYQNLILDLQEKIQKLESEKVKIIDEKIPQLKAKEEEIKLVKIKNIKDQIIKKKNYIKEINNKIKILQYNISPANMQNSKVVGGYIIKNYPVKPKKRLIIIVAFITSLIFGVFLVFLVEFWESHKKELKEI